ASSRPGRRRRCSSTPAASTRSASSTRCRTRSPRRPPRPALPETSCVRPRGPDREEADEVPPRTDPRRRRARGRDRRARPQRSAAPARKPGPGKEVTRERGAALQSIAERRWRFSASGVDVAPATNLPKDYVSDAAGPPPGTYTSPTDIGVYLWSVVAARDLHL